MKLAENSIWQTCFCTCVLHFGTFLSRSLQNNNKSNGQITGFYLVNTRMYIKRDIGKGQLCTPRNSRWGCATRPDSISDQNMSFPIFLRSRGSHENHTRFQTIMVKIYILFQIKTAQKAYSPRRMCRSFVNFSRELNSSGD